jgi:hypothetical protein
LHELFGLDLRSLAVLRIGLGLLLLGDLATRAADLRAHYTDFGVLPRAALSPFGPASLHVLGDSPRFQGALFLTAALFALSLLVGFHSRLACFASWFLLLSLHGRNPLILQGGDIFFRVLLFWGIFLPLGARFSLDALRAGPAAPPRHRICSAAGAALLLQICFVYWFAVGLKSDPVWRHEGTAVYYALSIDQTVTRFGRYLLGFPHLLTFLTFATLFVEAVGPALLFCPVATGPVRVTVVAGFLLFHLVGLNLCMELGSFPYVAAVAWLALLPGWFWDHAPGWLTALRARTPLPRALSALVPPRGPARRPAVAAGADPRPNPPPSALTSTLAGCLLVYVFLWNVRTLNFEKYSKYLPAQLNCIGGTLGLDQMWSMFAPYPLRDDGWYVVRGTCRDGTQVDVLRGGGPVRWEKPDLVSASYKNERWRKYLLNLWYKSNAPHRPYYAAYLFRDWNERHTGGAQLESLEIYFMLKVTLPAYQVSRPKKVFLCRYSPPPEGVTK